MLTSPEPETPPDTETPAPAPGPILSPDFNSPLRPIAELVGDPDFPKSALGLHVDIAGITGVITEIAHHSVKLRTPEGRLKSYNAYALCKLHAPPARPEPTPPPAVEAPAAITEDSEDDAPERQVITKPDFTQPLQPMSDWVQRADFPRCAWGAHVDLGGFSGVVVEIANQSLKILSEDGDHRSYNAAVLRKLHGGR